MKRYIFINLMLFIIIFTNAKVLVDKNIDDSIFKNDTNISINNFNFNESSKRFTLLNNGVLIRLDLDNKTSIIYFSNPIIQTIKIYEQKDDKLALLKDLSISKRDSNLIYPYFITDKNRVYIYAFSKYFPTTFSIKVDNFNGSVDFNNNILIDALILGAIISIFIAYLIFYLQNDRRDYIVAMSLIAIAGFNYIYFSGLEIYFVGNSFFALDDSLIGIKINILLIALSFFTIYIFDIKKSSIYYKGYILLIFISIIEIILSVFLYLYYIYIPFVLIVLVYNLYVGYRFLKDKFYEAIIYIVANIIFLIGILSYIFEIKLGYIIDNSIYYRLLFAISLILFASIMFISYIRDKIIENSVINEVFDKKLLLSSKVEKLKKDIRELEHTRDKLNLSIDDIIANNLNNTLSMLKLKGNQNFSYEITDEISKLNRRLSIYTRVYSKFLSTNSAANIDMRVYLPEIIRYIQNIYRKEDKRLKVKLEVKSNLPLSKAIEKTLYIVDILIDSFENHKSIIDDKLHIKLIEDNLIVKDLNKEKKRFNFFKKFF